MGVSVNVDALTELTATEKKAVREYLAGLKPKEIAAKLGISVRTVYKALWKYRKAIGAPARKRLKTAPQGLREEQVIPLVGLLSMLQQTSLFPKASKDLDEVLNNLVSLLTRLNVSLLKLNENIEKLIGLLERGGVSGTDLSSEAEVPSFLKNNPWTEVLRMRGKD